MIYLAPNSKAPDTRMHPHGHLDCFQSSVLPMANYGIVLDNEYLVVDIDSPELCPSKMYNLLIRVNNWVQKTRKGYHYLYKVPKGFKGKNTKLTNDQGEIYGDLKVKGYIVGPGSIINGHTYTLTEASEPPLAPKELLDLARPQKEAPSASEGALSGIPKRGHDDFLVSLGGWLRERYSLAPEAIAQVLAGATKILENQDPERPYTVDDIKRLAKSASRYEPSLKLDILPENWVCAGDIALTGKTTRWIVHRFVPKGELSLMYGKGGVGKSSWASWLVGIALQKGLKVGVASVEEPFERFIMRTYLGAPDVDLSNCYHIGNNWKFPRDGATFLEAIKKEQLDFVYFDSIYNHFELSQDGSNAAERGRNSLTPLAQACQETGVTILGTFHENKTGAYLGSTEMENVVRCLLHMTRAGKGKPAQVKVKKTNFMPPQYDLRFLIEEMEAKTPDGEFWYEENEKGELEIQKLVIVKGYEHIDSEEDDDNEPKEVDPKRKQAFEMKAQGMSIRDIADSLGVGKSSVHRWLDKYPEGLTIDL
jgi:hypothetical protein